MKHISHSFFRGFRRLSARSGSGSGPGRCFPVFPKGPAPAAQRGLWHPSGLWPDGCQGLCSKVASYRENDSLHFVRRSAPSKCVRCASLRSGGRRLAVRTAMGNHIGAMPRTPFPASRDFPSRGNERYEEKERVIYFRYHFGVFPLWWLSPPPCPVGSMSYDTERKSRNADFISIARRAIRNPRPEGPSNLRTLRPIGPVHLNNHPS